MGKRILQRRRGKGGTQFRVPSKDKIAQVRYPNLPLEGQNTFTVKAILDERGRSAPLAQLEYGNGNYAYVPAVVGVSVGGQLSMGLTAQPTNGNILPVGSIPEGTRISNIELRPGDGGKLVAPGVVPRHSSPRQAVRRLLGCPPARASKLKIDAGPR